jgi:hypothetical protein
MRSGPSVSLVISFLLIMGIYACTPTDKAFDASDYERGTGLPFPISARVLKGETRDWDFHGDHDACAIVELSRADYESLLTEAIKNPSKGERPTLNCSPDMNYELSKYSVELIQYASSEGGWAREWSLARDQPIVLIRYSSW